MAAKRKPEPELGKTAVKTVSGPTKKMVDEMRANAELKLIDQTLIGGKRVFTSGKTGYFFSGKILVDGVKCQVSCSVVGINTDKAV